MRTRLSDERTNMEVDVLMLCTNDQQQRNDENILAIIEGELISDETMSEIASVECAAFEKTRTDDDETYPCENSQMLRFDEMLTPADDWSGGVAPEADITSPLKDESAASSELPVLSASSSYAMRSDIVESQEEGANCAAVVTPNFCDSAVVTCTDDCGSDDNCSLSCESHTSYEPSSPEDDASITVLSETEIGNCVAEAAESDIQLLHGGHRETSVTCAEMISAASVINTYAVVDKSDVVTHDNSTLLVSVPVTEPAGDFASFSSSDGMLPDNAPLSSGLSDEEVKLELAEAIDVEAKKKSFRVRFHEEHIVTGYLDPPMPWREGL